jgi:hypothetical protein
MLVSRSHKDGCLTMGGGGGISGVWTILNTTAEA